MNRVFYMMAAASLLIFGCKKGGGDNQLSNATNDVKLGEAGTVTYLALDSLEITADYYPNENADIVIIMAHQDGFSRGEYKDIAPKMVDLGFACLAVDLRRGREANGVPNATAAKALVRGEKPSYEDAMQDLKATVDFVAANTDKQIVLWGSSYSASLSLMLATSDQRITKVIAFSPGEYLSNANKVGNTIQYLTKPVFITGGALEYEAVVQPLAQLLPVESTTAYKQPAGSDHGSKTLFSSAPRTKELYAKIIDFL